MDKFWKWMEEKGYCNDTGFTYWKDPIDNNIKYHYPVGEKSQMIIGYYLEYLYERHRIMMETIAKLHQADKDPFPVFWERKLRRLIEDKDR